MLPACARALKEMAHKVHVVQGEKSLHGDFVCRVAE